MKNNLIKFLFVLSICIMPVFANAYTITDATDGPNTYWGGTVFQQTSTYYGDVIGNPNFKIDQMDVNRSGNLWTVAISGEYFTDHQNQTIDGGAPFKLNPGDLYINSTGWIATSGTTNHYETDQFNALSEHWNYVVTYKDNKWGLYALDTHYNAITYTNVAPLGAESGWIFRKNQAWQGGAIGASLGDATYNLVGDTLTFTFDAKNITFGNEVGFHWTMQCGNDVIEGKVPVPEPTTMLLLGLGLIGVAGIRRKFKG
jgi:hypothetical protein